MSAREVYIPGQVSWRLKILTNQSRARFLLFFSAFFLVEAQSPSSSSTSGDAVSNFQPSLAVVIGILSVMFGLTFILLVYIKCCHATRAGEVYGDDDRILPPGGISRSRRFSGIAKTVVESLPFFRFSSLRGSKQGLECAVCLSKFEDVEVLRLLPKCKHAFHINCIDEWLEQHSSCPLCRHNISLEDPAIFAYSNSTRFSLNPSDLREDPNLELYVQREEARQRSSRFSIGGSFGKTVPNAVFENREEEAPIQIEAGDDSGGEEHVFHKIVLSDGVFKNRWSNVSSSDLIFLKSEMLNEMSGNRLSSLEAKGEQFGAERAIENKEIIKIKEEMDRKRLLESKVTNVPIPTLETGANAADMTSKITSSERRAMSEITALSRFRNAMTGNRTGESSLHISSDLKEERTRRLWLPIARTTVEWFADRETRPQHPQPTTQNLDLV